MYSTILSILKEIYKEKVFPSFVVKSLFSLCSAPSEILDSISTRGRSKIFFPSLDIFCDQAIFIYERLINRFSRFSEKICIVVQETAIEGAAYNSLHPRNKKSFYSQGQVTE